MKNSEFKQYPQGPRYKNQASHIVQKALRLLAHPKTTAKMNFDAVLEEWILELELQGAKQTFNIGLLLQHANLSHLAMHNDDIKKLSHRYVTYQHNIETELPIELENWPGVFQCLPKPLRMALRFYTSDFGEVANQFSRGEYKTLNPKYPPLMIFIVTCFINVALNRIPTIPKEKKHNPRVRAPWHRFHGLWRYEFDKKSVLKQLQQQQYRRHTTTLPHVFSTCLIKNTDEANVFIENMPNSAELTDISYFDDGREILLSSGTQLQFKKEDDGLFHGLIINTPELDHDYYYSAMALRHTYQHFLSKKYKDLDDTIQLGGQEIARPYHGLVHNLLIVIFLNWSRDLFAQHAIKAEFRVLCQTLSDTVLEKLRIVLLFLITGRESEVSFFQNAENYIEFKKKSRKNFLEFAATCPLFKDQQDNELSLDEYADLIMHYSNRSHLEKLPQNRFKLFCHLISFAHDLHLGRCYKADAFKNTMTNHFLHLEISSSHPTIIALYRAVFSSINRIGDALQCHFDNTSKIVDFEQAHRQPFHVFSNQVRLCDELLQCAPVDIPNEEQLALFLEYIQTEKAMKKTLLPNLAARALQNSPLYSLFTLLKKDWLQFFNNRDFIKCGIEMESALTYLSDHHPELLPQIMNLPHVAAFLRNFDNLLIFKNTTAMQHLSFPLVNVDTLKKNKINIIKLLKVMPDYHEKLLIDKRLWELFVTQVTPELLHELHAANAIPTLLQASGFVRHLSESASLFSQYLSVAPELVTEAVAWNSLITNYHDLAIILEHCISTQPYLLTDPEKIALISGLYAIKDALNKTHAYTSLLLYPTIKNQIQTLAAFIKIMSNVKEDFCLYIAYEYQYLHYIQNLNDWITLYNELPVLRERLLSQTDVMQYAKSIADYLLIAKNVPALATKIYSDDRFISLIKTTYQLELVLKPCIVDCSAWRYDTRINALLNTASVMIYFIKVNPHTLNWFIYNRNIVKLLNETSGGFRLLQLVPQYLSELSTDALFKNPTDVNSFVFIICDEITDENQRAEKLKWFINALIKAENKLDKLLTSNSIKRLIEHAYSYFKSLILDSSNLELRKICLRYVDVLKILVQHPEIINHLLADKTVYTYDLPVESLFEIFNLDIAYCVDWYKNSKIKSDNLAQLIAHDEELLDKLMPFSLNSPDFFDSQSTTLKYQLWWALPEKLIVQFFKEHSNIAEISWCLVARYFCIVPSLQSTLLPYVHRVLDKECQQHMLNSVAESERAFLASHFSKSGNQNPKENPKFYQMFKLRLSHQVEQPAPPEQFKQYKSTWDEIAPYLSKLQNNERAFPSTRQLQIIKANLGFIGMVMSCANVDEDTRSELIISINSLCVSSNLIMLFWQAYPEAIQNSMGHYYPQIQNDNNLLISTLSS